METQRCLYCGGDAAAPGHLARCDGRQGKREAFDAEPVGRRPTKRHAMAVIGAVSELIAAAVPAPHYPETAGYKEPNTSREAARSIDAATLRARVVACLSKHGAMTTDECAARLGVSVLAVRPRFSELRALDQILDTGMRHENVSGRRAVVWDLALHTVPR